MTLSFTEEPILNSLYEKPDRHWELKYRVPTDNIVQNMRLSEHIIPAPPSQAQSPQPRMNLGVSGISTVDQEYDPTPIINDIRRRTAPNQDMTTTDRQDQYHVRNVHTLKNLAILLQIPHNLLKKKISLKTSIQVKRLNSSWRRDYNLKALLGKDATTPI